MKYWKNSLIAIAILGLAACQTTPKDLGQWRAQSQDAPPFESSGRLAVKQNDKGSYANFDWASNAQVQQLSVNTPLGNTMGILCQDAQGVVAQGSDGQTHTATSALQLSEQLMGFAIPIDALDRWAHGYWHHNSDHVVRDDGRLQQDGWLIERQLNSDGQPRLLLLENSQLSIRLLFSDYRPEAPSWLPEQACERNHSTHD